MGNSIGRSRKAKVMKIDGETFKLKTPATAHDVVKDYPGHVLLDSLAVKHFGLRAKPLEPHQDLKPKKIYFLVELPKVQAQPQMDNLARRVRSSGIHMGAKERLELLMLSRRSISDISMARPRSSLVDEDEPGMDGGPVKVKMRLPKAQLDKLMEESHDEVEVAEKIISLYMGNSSDVHGRPPDGKAETGGAREEHRAAKKRVTFTPIKQREIQVNNQDP